MMKNYKFILLLIALLTPFIVFVVKNNSPKTIVKKITPKEKKVTTLSPPKVFALPTTPKEEKKVPKIFGRKIIGQKNIDKKNFKTSNKYNPKWKNILEKYLVKFQNKSVSVDVKLNEAYIMVKKNQGRLVEEVTVNYSEKGEHVSSFKAIVDSETGAILKTFDKITIQERRKPFPRLKPTGSIRNPPARRIKKD